MDLAKLVSVVSAIGFGIQQFLQVVADPIVSILISVLKKPKPDGTRVLPWGISDADAKKCLLGILSLAVGVLIVSVTAEIRILHLIGYDQAPGLDKLVTALTISAGTEGANSVVKLAQYAKDAVKKQSLPESDANSPPPPPGTAPDPV